MLFLCVLEASPVSDNSFPVLVRIRVGIGFPLGLESNTGKECTKFMVTIFLGLFYRIILAVMSLMQSGQILWLLAIQLCCQLRVDSPFGAIVWLFIACLQRKDQLCALLTLPGVNWDHHRTMKGLGVIIRLTNSEHPYTMNELPRRQMSRQVN